MRTQVAFTTMLFAVLLWGAGCSSSTNGPRHHTPWQMTVAPNQPLRVDHNTVLSVDERTIFGWVDRYDVLVGPIPGTEGYGRVAFTNSTPSTSLYEGFGYFLGTHPRVDTRLVSAAGEGTEMIVVAGAERDRVILLDSSTVKVVSRHQPPAGSPPPADGHYKVSLTEPRTFVDAWEDDETGYFVISEPKAVDSDPEVSAFVAEVLEAAATAGFIVQ